MKTIKQMLKEMYSQEFCYEVELKFYDSHYSFTMRPHNGNSVTAYIHATDIIDAIRSAYDTYKKIKDMPPP